MSYPFPESWCVSVSSAVDVSEPFFLGQGMNASMNDSHNLGMSSSDTSFETPF